MSWYQNFKKGATTLDELDMLIEKWHIDNSIEKPLHEFLGMSRDEYEKLILHGDILKQD